MARMSANSAWRGSFADTTARASSSDGIGAAGGFRDNIDPV